MGVSRRIQNLILDSPYLGAQCLRPIDLTRHLFGDTAAPPPPSITIGQGSGAESAQVQAADCSNPKNKQAQSSRIKMDMIRLPSPILTLHCTKMHDKYKFDCFDLPDRKVVIANYSGNTFLCDADTRRVVLMPSLHKPKSSAMSLFIPSSDDPDGGSLYVMERVPDLELNNGTQLSDQYEVFVCGKQLPFGDTENQWQCKRLPPPPFVLDRASWYTYHPIKSSSRSAYDPGYSFTNPKITSYAVVGSDIWICTESHGTYCFNTVNNTWQQVSKGTPLPLFHDKVEYVPEFKLWFGLTAEPGYHLAAADLSSAMMDSQSQPQLINDCKEFDLPDGWQDLREPQLVNLGSGRFCIARFYCIEKYRREGVYDKFAVFTGVEVMHNGDGKVLQLRMKKHKSICCKTNGTNIRHIF